MSGTSVTKVLDFLLSFFVVGFLLGIFGTILALFNSMGRSGSLSDLAHYFWYGFPVAFMILAIFWLYSSMKEWKLQRRL